MKLLHLDSSILGDASASRQLSHSVVAAWLAAEPTASLSYRDLAADALSHFSAASLVAAGTATELRDAAQQHEAELAESTLQEFLAADAIVIAAPTPADTLPAARPRGALMVVALVGLAGCLDAVTADGAAR